jgi:hypothetical protein
MLRIPMTLSEYYKLRLLLKSAFDQRILPPHMLFLKVSPSWRISGIRAQGSDFMVRAVGPDLESSTVPIIFSAPCMMVWTDNAGYEVVPEIY